MTRCEDELGWSVAVAVDEKHVAAGAVEQSCEDLGGSVGAILPEDTLVDDTSGDLESGLPGDFAENLVEARVAGRDEERAGVVADFCVVRWELCGCRRRNNG